MASCTTDRHGSSSLPYFTLTVTEDTSYSGKATTAKLDWTLQYIVPYSGVSSGAHGVCRATINGEKKDKDYTYGGKTGTNTVNSGSVYVTRSTSSKSVAFSIWVDWGISWSGTTYTTLEGSGSITISAKTSYTVSYNANGGSGAPGSQTKYAGTDLTLSSTKPTRTGYTFSKWNTNSSGTGTNYDPGSPYKMDAGATLYAQWIPNTYPVTYNNNGGTGAIASQTKTYGVNLKLSSTIPSRSLYNFVTWNTNASGSGTNYSPGANYTANAALTLYAIWEKAISPPIISNIVIQRCTDSTGSVIDEYNGRYAKIKFDWSCDQLPGNNPVTSIAINGTEVSSRGGTFSGSVTEVRGQFSADTSHNIEIVVTDSYNLSTTINRSLTSAKYAIDFKAGGSGVAFGKVATESNRLESAWPGYFAGLHNTRSLDNATMDMSYADMLYAIVTLTSSDDPDEMNTPGRYFVPSELVSTFASGYKIPYSAQYAGVLVIEKVGTLYGNVVKQTYIESSNNMREWTRKISGDNIYPWQETVRIVNWDNSHQANGWNYEQYSNGTAHLWGEFSLGAAKNFSWSNITRNGTIISYFTSDFSLPILPFDIKHANVIANFSNYSFWCSLYSQPSNNFGNTIKIRANSIVDYTNASNALVLDISVWGVHDATSGGGGGGGGGGSGGTGDYNIVSIDNGNGTQTLHITDAI